MKRSKTGKPPDMAGRQKVSFGLNFGFISFSNSLSLSHTLSLALRFSIVDEQSVYNSRKNLAPKLIEVFCLPVWVLFLCFVGFCFLFLMGSEGGEEVLKLEKDGKAQREKWLNNCKQLCSIWSAPNHGGSFSLASFE
nr:hypothetical protein CFP56_14526 [Quercus suber]